MALRAKKTRREREDKNLAMEEALKEETTRLNVDLPVSLHSQVKIRATQERSTITNIVIRALNEYLSKTINE